MESPPKKSLDDRPDLASALQALRAMVDTQMVRHERRLPPERQLAQQLGVSRTTLRSALAQLEEDGAVLRHVGRGTFIASGAQMAPQTISELSLQGALAIGRSPGLSPRDLLDVRLVIEPGIAQLAATMARRENIEEMRACLREREAATQVDGYEHWDFQLHRSIAKATHNQLLIELLDLVNRMRRTAVWRGFRRESIHAERKLVSDRQHRDIVDAITQADPKLAFDTMSLHVRLMVGNYISIDRDT